MQDQAASLAVEMRVEIAGAGASWPAGEDGWTVMERDGDRRRKLVWEIDRRLQEEGARPLIMHNVAATCMQPYVRGLVLPANSVYNSWRMEDVWLDR